MKVHFKVGDIVMIKPRVGCGDDYRSYYNNNMTEYENTIATITEVEKDTLKSALFDDDGYIYRVNVDDGAHVWNSSMFILLKMVNSNVMPTVVETTMNSDDQNKNIIKLKHKKFYKFSFKL